MYWMSNTNLGHEEIVEEQSNRLGLQGGSSVATTANDRVYYNPLEPKRLAPKSSALGAAETVRTVQ